MQLLQFRAPGQNNTRFWNALTPHVRRFPVVTMATEESTPAVPAASGAPVETGAGGAASGERGVTFSTLEVSLPLHLAPPRQRSTAVAAAASDWLG